MAFRFADLGLVNTREMYARALRDGYAVPGYNFNNLEQVQAIVAAAAETSSPVILQAGTGALAYSGFPFVMRLAQAGAEYAALLTNGRALPLALHLDHGDSYDRCVACIENGFSSVMIDGSHLPYAENVALTRRVAEYAHKYDVTVEGELGVLAGVEDEVRSESHVYTRPEEVEDFVEATGCDSLAIAIGTSHGAYKFKPGQKTELRLDILREIGERLPGFPIVLHGASSVPQEFVAEINKYGGNMADAIGIPEEMLRKAAESAVCKINIDSDIRMAMTAAIRKYMAENPGHFDPRQYLTPARAAVKEMVAHKIKDVLGCDGKA